MIQLKDGRRVQWTHLGKHYVGKVQVTSVGVESIWGSELVLIKLEPSCQLVQVKERELSPYPAEPIPEPTNTGPVS